MNALSPEARALIEGVATHDDPTRADKQRVRARLAAELGGAALGALMLSSAAQAGGTASLRAAAQRVAWSLSAKLSAAGAAALGLLLGALWLNAERVAPQTRAVRSAPPAAPELTAPATPGPEPEAAEVQARDRPPQTEAAARAPATRDVREPKHDERGGRANEAEKLAPAAAQAGDLAAELALLNAAQAALRAHDPERALALAAEHRSRFLEGVMKEERLGIEALANCTLGRKDRAQAEAFLRLAASSPLAARVRKVCGIEP